MFAIQHCHIIAFYITKKTTNYVMNDTLSLLTNIKYQHGVYKYVFNRCFITKTLLKYTCIYLDKTIHDSCLIPTSHLVTILSTV